MDIRVVIFEDHPLFRQALIEILNGATGYFCCGAFNDGKYVIENVERSRPHVVLMDIEMPGFNGLDATKAIHDAFPAVKVLIQTAFNDSERIFQAMCCGASGYILKNEPPQKYLEAITEVYYGGSPLSSTVATKLLGFFSNKNVILIAPTSEDYQLSTRENEMLQMIVKGEDFKSIAEKTFISYETVRTHFRNIYKKLHVSSRSEAVMKAIQQGLV